MKKIILIILAAVSMNKSEAQVVQEVSLYNPLFGLKTTELNGKLVYFGVNITDPRIIFTDGTEAGTSTLFIPEIASDNIYGFVEYNNKVYFSANGLAGRELWVTDGTMNGTSMLKDINPSGSSYPARFVILNNLLYFTAENGASGNELWRTDGTAIGTVMVKDINPGAASSEPYQLTVFNDAIYFSAYGNSGEELWKSDGTSNGTVLLKDINTTGDGVPFNFFEHENYLYFSARTSFEGRELWRTDGTELGTEIAADIASGVEDSYPSEFFSVGNKLFFMASTNPSGSELFWYNSQNGSVNMFDFNINGSSNARPVGYIGNTLLVAALNNDYLFRLHTFDLTTGIIEELIDLNLDNSSSGMFMMPKMLNDKLFFCANDGTNGRELWCTDGTTSGTHKIVPAIDVNGDPLENTEYLVEFNDALYFRGSYSSNGAVLCKVYNPSASIHEIEENGIRIFPNPANELVNIELKEAESIEIFDMIGNVVFRKDLQQGIQTLTISNLESGTYFIKGINSSVATKVIIQ